MNAFELPDNNVDFECPYGKQWNEQTAKTAIVQVQPSPVIKKAEKKESGTRSGGCGCSRNKG